MHSYVVRPKVDKSGDEEKTLYYGVPIISGQVDENQLSKEISQMCSLTPGDVLSAISALSYMMELHLVAGESVKLTGIGTFSISATSEGCETEEECTPSKVKPQRVCFKADTIMRGALNKIKYFKTNRAKTK